MFQPFRSTPFRSPFPSRRERAGTRYDMGPSFRVAFRVERMFSGPLRAVAFRAAFRVERKFRWNAPLVFRAFLRNAGWERMFSRGLAGGGASCRETFFPFRCDGPFVQKLLYELLPREALQLFD